MAIYRGSRYTKTPLYNDGERNIFKIRKREDFSLDGTTVHVFIEGDTLDGLAYKYYGDSQLWWVILEANNKYRSELDIGYGEELVIPNYKEVVSVYG